MLAIVGRSGAGKTTLVNLIPRFYDVTGGAIRIDGHDIRDVTLASLRRQIAIVTQETVLFDDTIAANIAYGAPEAAPAEIEAAARAAHAHEFIARARARLRHDDRRARPAALRRPAAAPGDRARASCRDSPILILDEATSSLDAESEMLVQDALVQPDAEPDVVRHRPPAVHRAPGRRHRRARARPRSSRSGTHEELLARGGAYAKLYELQLQEEPAGDETRDQVDDRVRLADARGRARDDRRHDPRGQPPVPRHPAPDAAVAGADLEPRVRALLQKRLARGRVELAISVQLRHAGGADRRAERGVRQRALRGVERARERGLVAGTLTPGDLLRLPQAITIRERAAEVDPAVEAQLDASVEAGGGRRRWPISMPCASGRAGTCEPISTRGSGSSATSIERLAGARPTRAGQRARGAAAGSRARDQPRAAGRPGDGGAGDCPRGRSAPTSARRSTRFRAHLAHWEALIGRRRAVRAQARLPAAGDEPRDQHHRVEGRRPPVSELIIDAKAELEKMREQVQNVE